MLISSYLLCHLQVPFENDTHCNFLSARNAATAAPHPFEVSPTVLEVLRKVGHDIFQDTFPRFFRISKHGKCLARHDVRGCGPEKAGEGVCVGVRYH